MPVATAATIPSTNTLLDPRQAAEYLRVKPQTLANWRMNGRGPEYVRLGRLIRYRIAQLEAWIAEQDAASR